MTGGVAKTSYEGAIGVKQKMPVSALEASMPVSQSYWLSFNEPFRLISSCRCLDFLGWDRLVFRNY